MELLGQREEYAPAFRLHQFLSPELWSRTVYPVKALLSNISRHLSLASAVEIALQK